MEELSYVLTQYFVSCVRVRFYFSLPLIFTSLAASISHFLTAALNFHVFLPWNSSPLFSVTRSSCFSVIHVCVNIKNNAEKDTTLLLFFLSNSPSRHVISFQIKPWVAFGLLYLLIELFYSGMPVMRTDGRCTVTWLPNFLGWVDYQISLAMEGILHAHACIRWTTIEYGHQIWWRGIENWRKGTVLLKAISFVLWIPYFPTKNILHDKNRTFSTRVFLL